MTADLLRLGELLRRDQDALLATRALPPLVLERPRRPRARLFAPIVAGVSFASLGAAAAIVVVFVRTPVPAPPPVATAMTAPSSPQAWIAPTTPTHLVLAGGGSAEVDAGAAVREWTLGSGPSIVQLDHGALVLASSTVARVVTAGPWDVDVPPETPVAVRFDPLARRLELDLVAGSVVVRGLDGARQTLVSGQHVFAAPTLSAAEAARAAPFPAPAPVLEERKASGGDPRAGVPRAPSGTIVSPATPRPTPTWQELAKDNRHREAMSAARDAGIDQILATAPVDELLLLGTSARLMLGDDIAVRAFEAARARFPGTPLAGRAAFFLARRAVDDVHDPARGVALLREYLEVAPNDAYRVEALGRIVEALTALHRTDEARGYAALCVAADPDGARAAACRAALP